VAFISWFVQDDSSLVEMRNFWVTLKSVARIVVVALAIHFAGEFAPSIASADEVVIDDRGTAQVNLGDFNCSSCNEQVTSSLAMLAKDNTGEVSAGQLWSFFHNQGISSLDRLTLCLDIDQLQDQTSFDLDSFQFQIEDPSQQGQFLTQVSLGDNRLVIPSRGTSSYKPEAKLEVLLGYDFMERFSADSTEMIKLDFSSNGELAAMPTFSIEGGGNVFTRLNTLLLLAFAAFWLGVFYVLHRMTKPPEDPPKERADSHTVTFGADTGDANSASRTKQILSS
jgi:hypothetical protein